MVGGHFEGFWLALIVMAAAVVVPPILLIIGAILLYFRSYPLAAVCLILGGVGIWWVWFRGI